MEAGTGWIVTGAILICFGAGLFVITHVVITGWMRTFEKNER